MPKKNAFTLIEVLIASVILTMALGGILAFTAQYLKGLDTTRNFSIAINAAQERMEKIKSKVSPLDTAETGAKVFTNLPLYNNLAFDVYGDNRTTPLANFKGISYVTALSGMPMTTYRVKVVVWWKEANGRVIGEDQNFDGSVSGEDTWTSPANGQIDAPVSIQMDMVNME